MLKQYNFKKAIKETLGTIAGAFIMAIGVSLFLLPNQLSSGGVSGIATITYYLFQIPMGITILAINLPLFLFSFLKIGKTFFAKTVLGTVCLSVFIDMLDKIQPLTQDRFLASIYGGIIIGIRNSNNIKSRIINRRK